jgi:hypothetical protein
MVNFTVYLMIPTSVTARFEVLTAVKIQVVVFWVVTP